MMRTLCLILTSARAALAVQLISPGLELTPVIDKNRTMAVASGRVFVVPKQEGEVRLDVVLVDNSGATQKANLKSELDPTSPGVPSVARFTVAVVSDKLPLQGYLVARNGGTTKQRTSS